MPTRFEGDCNNAVDADVDDEIWDLISVYADGEATPDEVRRIEELISSDAAYARRLTFIKTAGAAVSGFSEVDPPAALRESILAVTSHRQTAITRFATYCGMLRRSARVRFALPVAGLAAAGLLAVAVFGHHGSDSMNLTGMHVQQPHLASSDVVPPAAPPLRSADRSSGGILMPNVIAPQPPVVKITPPHDVAGAFSHSQVEQVVQSKHTSLNTRISPRSTAVFHPDDGAQLVATVYRPDMDAQNERPVATGDGTSDTSAADIPGPTVHEPEASTSQPAAQVAAGNRAVPDSSTKTVTYIAKLTPLPPDPNQVLTHADMVRNHNALTAGYDRTTLRSMERRETSISLLHGTF